MTPYRLSRDLIVNRLKSEINNTAPPDQTSPGVLVGKKLQAAKTILFRVCAFCRYFIPALTQCCTSQKKDLREYNLVSFAIETRQCMPLIPVVHHL